MYNTQILSNQHYSISKLGLYYMFDDSIKVEGHFHIYNLISHFLYMYELFAINIIPFKKSCLY